MLDTTSEFLMNLFGSCTKEGKVCFDLVSKAIYCIWLLLGIEVIHFLSGIWLVSSKFLFIFV
jgi:hypothetical protein